MDGDIASVAVAFQWLLLGIPFPFVSASCFFDSAVYNLSGPLIMKAFGIFIFRIEKYLRHNGNLGRCPLCRKDSDIASVAVAFQWLLVGIPFPFVSASCFFIALCIICLLL